MRPLLVYLYHGFWPCPRLAAKVGNPCRTRARATRIESILLERLDDPDLDILGPGGEGIGEDADPRERPEARHRVIAWLSLLTFGLLVALSVPLFMKMLGRFGASDRPDIAILLIFLVLGVLFLALSLNKPAKKFIRKVAAAMPVLSESVMREQDAALRALLRKFQAGKIDEALRRPCRFPVLPSAAASWRRMPSCPRTICCTRSGSCSDSELVPDQFGWGAAIHKLCWQLNTAKLPVRLRLEATIAGRPTFMPSFWATCALAANVLRQGGLFHDAAILYLKVLHDPRAAAGAFEAGGEYDRALALYLEIGQPLQAAELLRRAGDEDRALTYFKQAALEHIIRNGDYLAAGDLMAEEQVAPIWHKFITGKVGQAGRARMTWLAPWLWLAPSWLKGR